jgi:hypothetical protein
VAAITATGSSASIASSSSSGSGNVGRKGRSRLGLVKKAAQTSDSMDEPVPAPTATNPNQRPRT